MRVVFGLEFWGVVIEVRLRAAKIALLPESCAQNWPCGPKFVAALTMRTVGLVSGTFAGFGVIPNVATVS